MAEEIRQNYASSSFTVTALLDGSTINARLVVQRGTVIQYKNENNEYIPNWETPNEGEEQPVILYKVLDLIGDPKKTETITWYYNGVEIEWGSDNLSTNDGFEGKFLRLDGKFENLDPADKLKPNYVDEINFDGQGVCWPGIKIVKNLISITNTDNDTLGCSAQINYNGTDINLGLCQIDIMLRSSRGAKYTLLLSKNHDILVGSSEGKSYEDNPAMSTIYASFWNEGTLYDNKSNNWTEFWSKFKLTWYIVEGIEKNVIDTKEGEGSSADSGRMQYFDIINNGPDGTKIQPRLVIRDPRGVNGDILIEARVTKIKTSENQTVDPNLCIAFDQMNVEDTTDLYNIQFSIFKILNFNSSNLNMIVNYQPGKELIKHGETFLVQPILYSVRGTGGAQTGAGKAAGYVGMFKWILRNQAGISLPESSGGGPVIYSMPDFYESALGSRQTVEKLTPVQFKDKDGELVDPSNPGGGAVVKGFKAKNVVLTYMAVSGCGHSITGYVTGNVLEFVGTSGKG